MKKILLGLGLLSLAAAGCNSTNSTPQNQTANITQQNNRTSNTSQTGNAPILAGTKVYTNSQYRFQVSVPENDNMIQSAQPGFFNFMKDASTLDISISAEASTKTLEQKTDEFNMYQGSQKIQETNVTVAGVPAVKAVENLSEGGSNVWYLFVKNGNFYSLAKGPGLTNDQFDSMVNTFTFTE